jgi:hypothetical protein
MKLVIGPDDIFKNLTLALNFIKNIGLKTFLKWRIQII